MTEFTQAIVPDTAPEIDAKTTKFSVPGTSAEADNVDVAVRYADAGFDVIPRAPGSSQTAWPVKRHPSYIDRDKVKAHWERHPDHEMVLVPGDRIIVICAETVEAEAALHTVEKRFSAWPAFVVKTQNGCEHYFWLKSGSVVPSTGTRIDQRGHIAMYTGSDLVVLPPDGGKHIEIDDTSSVSDLTVVGQDFVDAIHGRNSSRAAVIVEAKVAAGETGATVPMPTPASPAYAPAGPVKGGKGGEAGGPAAVPDATSAFTGITTFGSPVGSAISPAMTPLADPTPPAGPVEGGKGGERGAAAAMIATAMVTPGATPAITAVGQVGAKPLVRHAGDEADDVFTPKAALNPVVAALKERGLYLSQLATGQHGITCPWAHEHAADSAAGATYAESDERNPIGHFHCVQLVHEKRGAGELLEFLGVTKAAARDKPVIRVVPGELHRVIDAAEMVLAARGGHFQAGGLIVSISIDPTTGDASILPTSTPALTRELSLAADWEVYRERSGGWVGVDPSSKHVSQLQRAQGYRHLPALAGVARQPYFRETDSMLVTQPGYDPVSMRFGVFDPSQFVTREPTLENARLSLAKLEELLAEFRFKTPADKSAALSGMFTATVRISLPYAPAFHITAPVSGSGKSYLSELIGAFAGPALNVKVSYPTTSEEATKMILSLLVTGPAVIEFDDMTTDMIPHGVINRILTSEWISDRILGMSKMATVSTRTFVIGSGNNVGPRRDLVRRVIPISLDPRCATPTTITYKGTPRETVRANRGVYVAAVLTVIQAWRQAGSPRANVPSIATYGGVWADYCRHTLIWLGLPDPAISLLEQLNSDPDAEALGGLMWEWYKAFGSRATTVRKVVEKLTKGSDNLADAIGEFPVVDRGVINRGKFGYLLKRNAGRIVWGMKVEAAEADGRNAWKVVIEDKSAMPVSPVSSAPVIAAVPPLDESDEY